MKKTTTDILSIVEAELCASLDRNEPVIAASVSKLVESSRRILEEQEKAFQRMSAEVDKSFQSGRSLRRSHVDPV